MKDKYYEDTGRREIHLWTFNHPMQGISDQVEYFNLSFSQAGYITSVGNSPKKTALNVVIENFSEYTQKVIIDFCKENKSRVAVVMTEHIDLIDGKLFIHGQPLWSHNDYMNPESQIERLKYLFSLQSYIKYFFVFGDLPYLKNISEAMSDVEVVRVPFPKLPFCDVSLSDPENDLLFTGVVTSYRKELLANLSVSGFKTFSPSSLTSHKKRDELNKNAKIVLNVPQRKSWPWLSSMRILAALRCGRATISLGTSDASEMAKCTYQIDLLQDDWLEKLRLYVHDWRMSYEVAYANYSNMAVVFEQSNPFPHDMIEYWAITDRIYL